MGESRDIALRRFYSTKRRLAKDSNLRHQYVAFMQEYQQLEHMKEVQEITGIDINHHLVKESSTTTKVRVVFDASCKTSTGTSLNDVLYAGPVIQEDLRAISIGGRTRQTMVVADVEKMFRQIWPCFTDLRFLNQNLVLEVASDSQLKLLNKFLTSIVITA
ncbi:uncharacterized protein LOC135709034 [Ochlerotatus camptorhynchus]|uniref:uncharacterized protein LOC135709034 n=1 Tax=Ochlerotatus camptorhynchus TaxID=644619 RepID=UPI0031CE4AE5